MRDYGHTASSIPGGSSTNPNIFNALKKQRARLSDALKTPPILIPPDSTGRASGRRLRRLSGVIVRVQEDRGRKPVHRRKAKASARPKVRSGSPGRSVACGSSAMQVRFRRRTTRVGQKAEPGLRAPARGITITRSARLRRNGIHYKLTSGRGPGAPRPFPPLQR